MIQILSGIKAAHQLEHQDAIYLGFKNIGIDCEKIFDKSKISSDASCWGWRLGKQIRDLGKNALVIERGYIGDRFKYTSLGWNGLNNYAKFAPYPDDGGKRFKDHGGIIKPWNKDGGYILILGQVKNDASLQGKDITNWYMRMAKEAKEHYGLPVYFRQHPDAARRGGYAHISRVPTLTGTLQNAIDGALFTIAYNSNSCLDSILSGKPCYAGDSGTMAHDLCMKDLKELYYPEREKKVHSIAWNQFTIEEIASGWPLKGLIECRSQF